MNDVDTIVQSLHEALIVKEQDESTLTELISQYLQSSNPTVNIAGVDALCDVLRDATAAQRKLLLEETSLTFIPLILPLLSSSSASVSAILTDIASTARPREVVLALNEALQSIDDRAEGFVVSDDEDGLSDEDEGVDYAALIDECLMVLECYTIAIPRLPNAKSTPTLLSLESAVSLTIPLLAHHQTASTARATLSSLCRLVATSWDWVQTTSDTGGEQRAILTNLLSISIALLGDRVDARLAERFFAIQYPRFALTRPRPNALEGEEGEGQAALGQARHTAETLGIYQADLLKDLTNPASISPYPPMAALILLASTGLESYPPNLLNDSTPVLSAAISSSAVDAGLTWLWMLVEARCTVTLDNAETLLELLVPLAAFSPRPLSRLSTFKLIAALIGIVPSPDDQITLFKRLLEPENRFQGIRVQAVTLLAEFISSPTTALLVPSLTSTLSPLLFALPAPPEFQYHLDTNRGSPEPSAILGSMYPAWFTACAHTLYVWAKVDRANASGIRDEALRRRIPQEWLDPQHRLISAAQRALDGSLPPSPEDGDFPSRAEDGDFQSRFVLERWNDALHRAKAALAS